jgi:hypothetical protein
MPRTSSAEDAATAAARKLIYALQNPHPVAPIAPLSNKHQEGLRQLEKTSKWQLQLQATPRDQLQG